MPLRINLPRAMLPLLANRLLPDFLEAYPNVQLELCGDDNFIDIVEQGFDAGIRMAGLVPTDMIAVPLTPRIRCRHCGRILCPQARPTVPPERA